MESPDNKKQEIVLSVYMRFSSEIFDIKNKLAFVVALLVPCGISCLQCRNFQKYIPEGHENKAYKAYLLACCFCAFGAALNRFNLTKAYHIEESYWSALLMHCCCCCCAVSQEAFEVEKRGTAEKKKKSNGSRV